jgi:hypothetical protein
LERVREYEPDASYFVTPDAINLMFGDHHTETPKPQENIALDAIVRHMDCGDW